ncbi:MAG: hypothetical protein CUN49_07700 [Candidatus Thermofonsia Clade 1 bacterium]|uniref:FHA domain-containing protein n=1 Tax=Candidatus Thermofonsia Clade 1 bacterium TaxID=2364210 RepID=A0A2M8PEK2_9CHLR|nr:MAG: hypothetical protein CUN49_07700 [Candidatus Thermofonsia Clade 1 bacterium]RMF53470.1 MAG: DUF2662 domain-containing protein [Chloroflexota bacterium]
MPTKIGFKVSLRMRPSQRFERLEARLAQLIEGSFARLFASRLHPHEVASRLAHALEEHLYRQADGSLTAPDQFLVRLNAEDHAALLAEQPDLAQVLAASLVEMANRAELRLLHQPQVTLLPEAALPLRSVQVEAAHTEDESTSTNLLPCGDLTPPPIDTRNPQLVYNNQAFPLRRPVINIGRKHDNHIVIDSPYVSRHHAQLRLRFGRYVLYDLNSRGGTFVNGHRIAECILKAGDVIGLSQVLLVYVEDEPSAAQAAHDTQLRSPLAQDSPPDAE